MVAFGQSPKSGRLAQELMSHKKSPIYEENEDKWARHCTYWKGHKEDSNFQVLWFDRYLEVCSEVIVSKALKIFILSIFNTIYDIGPARSYLSNEPN